MKLFADEIVPITLYLPVIFHWHLKSIYIKPALKKPGLNVLDVQSFSPISNLPVVSKLLEQITAKQLNFYLQLFDLLPYL